MIQVDFSTAVAVYIIFWMAGLLILWAILERRPTLKNYSDPRRNLWQCAICASTYIDSQNEAISKCPVCGSFNERKPKEARNDTERMQSKKNEMEVAE